MRPEKRTAVLLPVGEHGHGRSEIREVAAAVAVPLADLDKLWLPVEGTVYAR